MSIIVGIPGEHRGIFIAILAEKDQTLLDELQRSEKPTIGQWESVASVFMDAFGDEIRADGTPSRKGVQIDNALGAFFTRFPDDDLADSVT